MSPTVVVDTFESPEFEVALQRYQLNTVRDYLVGKGLADVYWIGQGSIKYTFEHKTAIQAASEMGERLDGQLRKHSQHADVVGLIIDGVMTPRDGGGIDFWKLSEAKKKGAKPIFYKYRHSKMGYEVLQAYLWSLNRDGIYAFTFPTLDALGLGLAAFISNSLKTKHNTLTHHIRSKPVTWEEDPYVLTLMGLNKARIGEITARKILEAYDTPWDFFRSGMDKGEDIVGRETFLAAMRSIGRKTI